MLDKLKYALSLFDSSEISFFLVGFLVYHLLLVTLLYLSIRYSVMLRFRALEAERDEFKKYWENRDAAWKEREDELRRIYHLEKDREFSQIKAEYDSYVHLLQQKLMHARTRGM